MMARQLEAPQRELSHEVADVEAVASGIKAAIERDRSAGQTPAEAGEVGALRGQFAPLEVFEQVHGERAGYRGGRGGGQGESDWLMPAPVFSKRRLITGKTVCLDGGRRRNVLFHTMAASAAEALNS